MKNIKYTVFAVGMENRKECNFALTLLRQVLCDRKDENCVCWWEHTLRKCVCLKRNGDFDDKAHYEILHIRYHSRVKCICINPYHLYP